MSARHRRSPGIAFRLKYLFAHRKTDPEVTIRGMNLDSLKTVTRAGSTLSLPGGPERT